MMGFKARPPKVPIENFYKLAELIRPDGTVRMQCRNCHALSMIPRQNLAMGSVIQLLYCPVCKVQTNWELA